MNVLFSQDVLILYFDLNLILRVFTAPNTAFAQIRDGEEKYFEQSVVLLIAASFITILTIVPFLIIPLDDIFLEELDDFIFGVNETDMAFTVISAIVSELVIATVIYFVGKKLGGNKDWKPVFSVSLHVNVLVIPMMMIISILLFLMLGSLSSVDVSSLTEAELDEDQVLTLLTPLFGYVGLLMGVVLAFGIWIIVVSVKAIKVINGFGTAKAFGLLILSIIVSLIVTIPLGL